MADIRIKDLTTEVSSTATGDFFVIDGTTGTRRTPAFNPTFGGNAAVTGTLTVNGTGSSLVATTTPFAVSTGVTVASGGFGVGAVGTGGSFFVNTPSANSGFSSGLAIDGSYPGGIGSQSVINIKAFGVMSGGGYGSTLSFQTTLNGTFNEVMRMTSDKQVSILGTNASTTTSSGALVVGNGTSGGLGVGGAINAGGGISTKLSTNNSGSNLFSILRADGTTPLLTATDANDGLTLKLGYTGLGNSSNWISLTGNGGGPGANITLNNGVVASFGGIAYQVNGLSRWYVSRSTTAETGSNAGSDFAIISYNDAGATIGTAFSITRSNSAVQCAGTLTAFGAISASSLNTTNGTTVGPFTTSIGADATLGALTVSMGGSPSATGSSRFGYIGAGDSQDWRRFIVGSNNTSGGGQVLVPSTLSSTSTASGALVVSGGVGVGGSQYLGVKLNISTHTGDAGGIGFGTETNLYRYQAGGLALDHASGAAPGLLFRENGSSTLRLETNSGVGYLSTLTSANLILRTNATTALTLDTSQNAIFAGTIRTAAPVGGTAASWKLGTVATVSPTSPNRTIEVDIGGTIYYIHAKTTNN